MQFMGYPIKYVSASDSGEQEFLLWTDYSLFLVKYLISDTFLLVHTLFFIYTHVLFYSLTLISKLHLVIIEILKLINDWILYLLFHVSSVYFIKKLSSFYILVRLFAMARGNLPTKGRNMLILVFCLISNSCKVLF